MQSSTTLQHAGWCAAEWHEGPGAASSDHWLHAMTLLLRLIPPTLTIWWSNATNAGVTLQSSTALQHTISTTQVGMPVSDANSSCVTMSWHRLIVPPGAMLQTRYYFCCRATKNDDSFVAFGYLLHGIPGAYLVLLFCGVGISMVLYISNGLKSLPL